MENVKDCHNKAYYRVVKTNEVIDGEKIFMYGVEGFGNGESVSVFSLSPDKARITALVKLMNEGELELCHLREVVDDFLYERYGSHNVKL